ncbi:quorum-sensing phosphorelay protein LuxU [Vibrio sp. CAU 1672]|uniref:quorum-sensing phosphorelay protein LuxU n=1 Tax=Vibrio sp. CAU 1672 TaxID=3032594 RepID=UPI0023DB1397|nr:quorum-sensing phosphorelay protein LuxU [Vibrio sp. CAU 1672]MDF2153874.1 Hpt domain-containing protein [Vibrio sp. CAU 1672]
MDVLNESKITELAEEIGVDNVPVLLGIFLGEMDTYIDTLAELPVERQEAYLKEISHALKSSAASFGADCLCDLALTIDKQVKAGQLTTVSDYAAQMQLVLETTRERYRSWQP